MTPNVTFRLNREEAPYGFAYVLTEDGMSSHNWKQANFYTGRTEFRGISEELDYLSMPLELFIILKTTLLLLLQME